MPKCEYSSSSSFGEPFSAARRNACSEPAPGFPAHENTSFRAHPAAIIWS